LTFSLVKKPSMRSTIQLSWMKKWSRQSLKAKKKAGFSLLSPGQRSSSHCGFNDGNSTETEVGCPASSAVQSRLSSIWLSFVWTNEEGFKRQEIPE
jgi:hypothetical protein